MGELIELRPGDVETSPAVPDYDGKVCACGSAWFRATVAIGEDGRVGGIARPVLCLECGAEATP